jgi:hypothetical protein
MRILPALSSAALAAGCALGPVHIHRGVDASDHLEYLVRALTADTQQRESLWQAALKEPEAELQDLLSHSPNADVAPVARARLEDLHLVNGCRQEVEGLKRRLSKVADIERRLDQERK